MTIFFHLLVICIFIPHTLQLPCSHDSFGHNHTKTFLNDFNDKRLLQAPEIGRLRIFVDYNELKSGGATEINTIKRVLNITASYFYTVLNVTRLPRLYFPSNQSLECSLLKVPEIYATQGVIGDIGIMCGNQQRSDAVYIAKSISCVHLQTTKRPIWGMIMFNNFYLKYDQQGFQEILFVGMHQMTHILGFSASMYQMYPKGSPLVKDPAGNYFLSSDDIQRQIKNHFGCSNSKGLPLQDQDGTLIASHWERKVLGNQFMIATNKKNSFVSIFTLALLNSTGWYTSVNRTLSEPTVWGKGKGCTFLDIQNCNSDQFCTVKQFMCDHDGTGIGQCGVDPFSGSCMIPKYYVNTICVDENYEAKNLNSNLNAIQRGGSTSRCFQSDFRQSGVAKNKLNNRCYVSMCSLTGKSLFILVGPYVLVCTKEGQSISAPIGFQGTLTCPRNFGRYCSGKKTCPYHCNKNGACVNGKCLCTGTTFLANSCADVSIFKAPIGNTGGLLNSFKDPTKSLTIDILITTTNKTTTTTIAPSLIQKKQIKKVSINSKCIQGTTFDKIFGQCLKCSEVFKCQNCDDSGCISCDNGKNPVNGQCK